MKKLLIFLIGILISINLTACGNSLSNRQLRKMLTDNGYDAGSAKVETILDLSDNIDGLDKNGDNKLVLTRNNNYGFVIANPTTGRVLVPTLGFIPLNVVQQNIWNGEKDINMQDIVIIKDFIERYGCNCFENKKYAEEYLRKITGPNGIIATGAAQSIISNSTKQIFPDIKSNDEVTVIFEENSAVPMYYIAKSIKSVYNWNSMFSEDTYKVWAANTDTKTQNTVKAIYGQPYVSKEVWEVVDSDLKEAGTYYTSNNSLEDVKKKLMKKQK